MLDTQGGSITLRDVLINKGVMRFNETWSTINDKLNKAIGQDNSYPLLLIGGYRRASVAPLNDSTLFDEFIDGDPEFDAMEVDPKADDSEQFEQFTRALRNGLTFGDYQEFASLKERLSDFQVEIMRMKSDGVNPAKLWDMNEWLDVCRVEVNGSTVDLSDKVRRWNNAFAELYDYIDELNMLYE